MTNRRTIAFLFILSILTSSIAGQGFREILSRKDNSTYVFNFKNTVPEAVPTFVDIDGDKDLDIFLGQEDGRILFYENSGNISGNVSVYFNIGDSETPLFSGFFPRLLLREYRGRTAPAIGDIDNGGDIDMMTYPSGNHMEWYMGVAGHNHFIPDTLLLYN